MSREIEFAHGATVRELISALDTIPENERDLEVTLMFYNEDDPGREHGVPGIITDLDPFPATTIEPQPRTVVWTIRGIEGTSTAADIETMRAFEEFLEGGTRPSPDATEEEFDRLYASTYDLMLNDMKESVREYMVSNNWATVVDGKYVLTELGREQLKEDES